MGAAARIHWLPNAVHRSWRGLDNPPATDRAEPVLRYLPGTRSHDRDFALVAPVLSALLRANAFTPTVVRADNLRYYRSGPVARLEGVFQRARRLLTGKKEPNVVAVARKTA